MDDIIKEFLVESFESLDRLDQEFVALESDPSNTEILNAIFRTIHTIKGTCGFLSFSILEKITHVGETLLDSLRAGRCVYTTDTASALLKLVDATRSILENIEATGGEGDETFAELAAILTALNESNG